MVLRRDLAVAAGDSWPTELRPGGEADREPDRRVDDWTDPDDGRLRNTVALRLVRLFKPNRR